MTTTKEMLCAVGERLEKAESKCQIAEDAFWTLCAKIMDIDGAMCLGCIRCYDTEVANKQIGKFSALLEMLGIDPELINLRDSDHPEDKISWANIVRHGRAGVVINGDFRDRCVNVRNAVEALRDLLAQEKQR